LALGDDTKTATRPVLAGTIQPGKDEFGRDIRPPSPNTAKSATTSTGTSVVQQPSDPRQSSGFVPARAPPHPVQSPTMSSGLDQIDFTTFDFSSAAAWEALGKAWEVTHGSLPSQEQLMQLVVGRMAQAGSGNPTDQGGGDNGWKNSQQPGKSIPTYESGSNLNTSSWHGKGTQADHAGFDYEHGGASLGTDTDAVVLGDEASGNGGPIGPSDSSATGGMKRVGDGWVWQPS
jgi:protein NRD1